MQLRHTTTDHSARPVAPPARSPGWRAVAAAEVALVVAVVVLDLFVPALLVLVLAVVSLRLHRAGPASLGLRRPARWGRLVLHASAFAVVWSLVTVGLTKPVAEHLSGERQDVSGFAEVEGNLGLLLVLLALSWTLAAFVETVAFTGFLQTRMAELVGGGTVGLGLAVLAASSVFGLLHTEQGVVGVTVSTVDAVFYAVLRYRYGTLWAPILTHGLINTIGMITFFLVGPVYGLW